MEEIINSIKMKSDEQLLNDVSLGPGAFRDNIYQLYCDEARNRGLDISVDKLNARNKKNENDKQQESGSFLKVLGWVFLFFTVGLLSFIPGLLLFSKSDSGEYLYPEDQRKSGKFFIICSAVAWFIVIVVIIGANLFP